MKFLRIDMLFFIWLLPVFALAYFYGGRKRRRILKTFIKGSSRIRIVPQGLTVRRRWRALLVLVALLLTVTAIAGPQYGFQWQTIEQRGIDMIIALDCSRSMLATDIQPTRLDRAKREIYDLLAMLQGDRVGLAAFSGTAFLQCPLTLDYHAFNLFLDVLAPDYLPVGGTDLAAVIQTATDAFDPHSSAEKAIILITDGEHTGHGDPMEAVRAAQQAGITLFCIGVGSDQGVPIPSGRGGFAKDKDDQIVLSRLDQDLLTRMATSTGGIFVRSVAGDMDLEAIYRDHIRAKMDQAMVEGGRKQVWANRFQWPLGLAVTLLLAALWIPAAKKGSWLTAITLLMVMSFPWTVQAGPTEGYRAYQKGQYDQALKQFIEGQLEDPDNPELMYNIGNTYYKNGDFDAAEGHYRQAQQVADPGLKPKLLYNLGNTAYRQGRLQEAVEYYQKTIDLLPDDVQAKENLTFVQKQLQEQQQQQQSDQGRDDQSQDDAPPSQKDPNQNNGSSDPNKAGRQQPEQGQSQGDGQQDQQAPPQYGSQSDDQGGTAEQQQQPDQAAGQPEHQTDQQKASSSADHALGRLKDEPGRALMPNYQKRRVEKDW